MERFVENTIVKYPRLYNRFFNLFKNMDDKKYISLMHRLLFKEKMDWDNPKTFTQKLNWLKINFRDPVLTTIVDKYLVRDYVKDIIGEEYLIPLYGVYSSSEDIKRDLDNLPNKFVIKGNNGSGYNIICSDKDKLDWNKAFKLIDIWLGTSHYLRAREWPYKNVKPLMVVEEFLKPKEGILVDYKFYAFDGDVKYVGVTFIDNENHLSYRNNYDIDFNLLKDVQIGFRNNPNVTDKKPENYEKMLEIARTLSKGFPHLRVDLYNVDGKIYFGELTVYPGGGTDRLMKPEGLEEKMGSYIKLMKRG